jgi:magnesium chelatase family protein
VAVFKSQTISLIGLVGELITVEVDISDGLPNFTLLGLPDTALNESKERVRTAITNSNSKVGKSKDYSFLIACVVT